MRKKGFAIGRMYYAHSTSSERCYLRMLLNCVKSATSYEHLRTMDGIEHDTFKNACITMGLLADDNEWHQALEEASLWASGRQLRDMFASMVMFCKVTNPRQLWDAHWEALSDDIEVMTRRERDDPAIILYKDVLKDCCRNPNLGLVIKARGCKVAGQEEDPKVTSHVPGSAKSVRE
jgi:hypothetical protein